jgi:hypothetical protein
LITTSAGVLPSLHHFTKSFEDVCAEQEGRPWREDSQNASKDIYGAEWS